MGSQLTKGVMEMGLFTKINIELKDFEVPDTVEEVTPVQTHCAPVNGYTPPAVAPILRRWKLSELPAETLRQLCDEFTSEVFRKAGQSIKVPECS